MPGPRVPMAVLIVLMLGCWGPPTEGAPSITIGSPPDGAVLHDTAINVTGNASGSLGTWFQGTRGAFLGGSMHGTTVDVTGHVVLAGGVDDNFDDDKFDTAKWTKTTVGMIDVSEEGNLLRLGGRCSTQGTWNSRVWVMSVGTVTSMAKATLTSFAGTGAGYASGFFMYQDADNYLGIGEQYEESQYGAGIHIIVSAHVNGSQTYEAHGTTTGYPHVYKVTYSQGEGHVFQDATEVRNISLALTNPKVLFTCGARENGNTVDARWDDVVSDQGTQGTFVSTVHDTLSTPPVLTSVEWNATIPPGTSVGIEVRSSDTSRMDLSLPWMPVDNGQRSNLPVARRFLQYRVTLTRTVGQPSPALDNLTIVYRRSVARVELSADGGTTWSPATGTNSWKGSLSLTEHTTTIRVKVTDAAGLVAISSIRVVVDISPPFGTVVINGGDTFTGSTDVVLTLNVTALSGTPRMKVSNWPDLRDATWRSFSSRLDWSVPPGDGPKTVYACFLGANGHVSTTVNDSIILHTGPPEGSLVIDGGAAYTNSTSVALTLDATDPVGVEGMLMGEGTDLSGSTWMPYARTCTFALTPGDGEKRVYAAFRDSLGHVSPCVGDSIVLDTRPPIVSLLLMGGAENTNSRAVVAELSFTEECHLAWMQVSEDPRLLGAAHETAAARWSMVLSTGDGSKTVYARACDAAGNVGVIASDSIVLDESAPVMSFLIDGGAPITRSLDVVLSFEALAGFPAATLEVDVDAGFIHPWSGSFIDSLSWALSQGDGDKLLFARATDAAGNIGPTAWASIVLDTAPPVLRMDVNEGAEFTSSREVTLRLESEDPSGVVELELSSDPSPGMWSSSMPFKSELGWTLADGDGEKTVFGRARDGAGNWGSVAFDSIVLDTTAPDTTINASVPAPGTEVIVSWHGSDALSGVAYYDVQIREGNGPWTEWLPGTDSTSSTYSGERGHTYGFRVRARDGIGNLGVYALSGASVATVTVPEKVHYLVGSTVMWVLLALLIAGCVGLGHYLWRRRRTTG